MCDEGTDQCVPQPVADGTGCDDGLYCTMTDECQGGLGVGSGETCPDDGNDCTDNCDEATDTCYLCNATGTSDPCCEDPICSSEEVCLVAINEFYVDGTNGDNLAGDELYSQAPEYRPKTKFEKRGERLGHGVWDLLYKK